MEKQTEYEQEIDLVSLFFAVLHKYRQIFAAAVACAVLFGAVGMFKHVRSQKAADLCSGCGIVSLEWHDRGHRGLCAAVELQPEASALLQEAVTAQGIEHITPYLTDLRTFREGEGQFDVCACNPPYFTAGPQSTDAGRATARHETDCTLEDVCACGFRLLKDGGKLSLCHRPERLAEVLAVLRAHRLEPKRLAFVKNKPDAAPCLFLVEAQKNRRTGLRIEPDVLITAGAAMYGEVK